MALPGTYRTLGQELWREMADTLTGVLAEQEVNDQDKLSFVGWVNAYHPRYEWYAYNRLIAELLQLVAEGKLLRLMLCIPPRHGKSELVSRLFTAYYLYLHAHRWVGLCSYGATLAETLSRNARSNFQSSGGDLRFDSRAVTQWETTAGGGMWAAGVGGGILGKGAHLAVIDDPTKDAVEANSETTQRVHQEWWQSTFYTRLEPGAAIVIVMQRWHEMDLIGWLLKRETERSRPMRWRIVAWEAIKEEEIKHEVSDLDPLGIGSMPGHVDPAKVKKVANYLWPTTVQVEPDWRKAGEALCPQRYDLDALLEIKDGLSAYYWAALYQQRPRPREGMLFKLEHFKVISPHEMPRLLVDIRAWDYAATEDANDFTAGVRLGIGIDNNVYVRHCVRGQWDSATRDAIIRQTVTIDGFGVYQGREQEPGASGKDTALKFMHDFPGYKTFVWRPTGSKFERADPLIAAAQSRGIYVIGPAPWVQEFIDELIAFGSGTAHDDVADASAGAYNEALVRVRLLMAQTGATGSHSLLTNS